MTDIVVIKERILKMFDDTDNYDVDIGIHSMTMWKKLGDVTGHDIRSAIKSLVKSEHLIGPIPNKVFDDFKYELYSKK